MLKSVSNCFFFFKKNKKKTITNKLDGDLTDNDVVIFNMSVYMHFFLPIKDSISRAVERYCTNERGSSRAPGIQY